MNQNNHAYNSTQPLSMLALDFTASLKNVNHLNQYETFSPKQANGNQDEIELMKQELKDKDLMIQNLKERLVTLEKEFKVRVLDFGTKDQPKPKLEKEESRDKS